METRLPDMTAARRQLDFAALLREHQGIVLKIAAIYADSRDDREDLAQEIAAQLWRSYARYDARRAKFSTWMYRVALNVAITHARRRKEERRTESLEPWQLDTLAGDAGIAEPDPRLAELHAFIGRLDALNRALMLLYLDDRSYAEIADVLGLSATNVATKLNRIKNNLREQMTTPSTSGA